MGSFFLNVQSKSNLMHKSISRIQGEILFTAINPHSSSPGSGLRPKLVSNHFLNYQQHKYRGKKSVATVFLMQITVQCKNVQKLSKCKYLQYAQIYPVFPIITLQRTKYNVIKPISVLSCFFFWQIIVLLFGKKC